MLTVHRGARGDVLASGLAALLASPGSDDPFEPEVVAVPTHGIERWLTQRLGSTLGAGPGRGDGVCANVEFPFPARLVGGVTAAATGIAPDEDPWAPERSAWALLEVVDAHLGEPWLGQLAEHLGRTGSDADPDESRAHRRFATVRRLADLFDRYGVHRPSLVRAWAAGVDCDDDGRPLDPGTAWQAELWRLLRSQLGVPSPAERLAGACRRLAADPGLVALPHRLSLFGLTRLPGSYLEVLRAVGEARDVHLWLLHPSPALWREVDGALPVAAPREHRAGGGAAQVARAADPTVPLARHPLLRSWGRDAREMQLVIGPSGITPEAALEVPSGRPSLLGRIQRDIRDNAWPPAPGPLEAGDDSVRVHACHGRARQVEVLRDVVLHLLEDDPTLEARDVIVLCPDIDDFAPLVQATFGAGVTPGAAELRVRLADRSLRQTNPVLASTSLLLELAAGRATTSEVLDLLGSAPVRRRFRLDDDELARIERWSRDAGVRWGLDAGSRSAYLDAPLDAGTWAWGLDRILLGVAMSEDELPIVGGVLPLDDVDSGDVDLAGRLAEAVDRIQAAVESFAGAHPLAGWTARIADAADALFAVSGPDEWQTTQLRALLDGVTGEAAVAGSGGRPLVLSEVRALLADRLRGRPTRANFRTGHLTMCTLVPMRSVPHRVVCLLGLDDGAFPRRAAVDGDDVLALRPRVGDRDARSEDRQLLLDALLAAGDHLVVTYSGRDERTNAPRPPCVPIGELLDVVEMTVTGAPGAARRQVVVHHPLQPFDERNFRGGPGTPGRNGAWSFDRVALAGARAQRRAPGEDRPSGVLLPAPPAPGDVRIDQLVAVVEHPVRAYLRQGLGVRAGGPDDDPDDALPMVLDALESWQVGDRLLAGLLDGVDPRRAGDAEAARGTLPPGPLGRAEVGRILPVVLAVADAAGRAPTGGIEVDVDLGGRRLTGTIPGVAGDTLGLVTYSKVAARHRLGTWARLLALVADQPDRPWRARLVGRRDDGAQVLTLAVPDGDPAVRRARSVALLAQLVGLHDRARREPLPLAGGSAFAWVTARRQGRDPVAAARKQWEGRFGEGGDAAHLAAFGRVLGFDELLAAPPDPTEAGPGWDETEPTRFGRLAQRLCAPLLDAEVPR